MRWADWVDPERCWLTLCILTETNRAVEMPLVGWVVRNRVDRRGRFSNSYFGVVTQNKQFSYFNAFQPIENSPEDFYRVGNRYLIGRPNQDPQFNWDVNEVKWAYRIAGEVMAASPWQAPFDHTVDHYWSPCSMLPKGSAPPWAKSMYRTFTMPGVDPDRFVFAQEHA